LELKIAKNAKQIHIDDARKEVLMRQAEQGNDELRELQQKLLIAKVNKDRKKQLEQKQDKIEEDFYKEFQEDKD